MPTGRSESATITGFEALGDTSWEPPDTNGSVGPNHLMTVLNGGVLVQTKAGSQVGSVMTLSDWWGLSGDDYAFDPVTLYDSARGRWINVAVSNGDAADSAVLVSVSAGTDPSAAWDQWYIDADPSDEMWADRPYVGFSDRWLVVTVNMYDRSGGSFNSFRPQVYAFDLSAAYGATLDGWHWDSLALGDYAGSMSPAHTYDTGVTTSYLLAEYNGNSGGAGWLRMWTITGPLSGPVLSSGQLISVAYPWNTLCGDIAPQLGTPGVANINLDVARMQKVLLRNGELWAVHTVCFPASGSPTAAGIQWWNLTTSGSVIEWGRLLDVDGSVLRGYPSIAVNADDDVLIGYARFTAAEYAHAAYAYRPVGGTWFEEVFRTGLNTYERSDYQGRNRWGDYTATSVDPDGVGFWTIGEYAASTVNTWSTWWAHVVISEPVTPVVRYAGANRYATAAAISAGDFPDPDAVDTVFVATGLNFPDGLAGAAVAAKLGVPLLLVNASGVSTETATELGRLTPDTIVILGGTGVIPDTVKTILQGYAPTVTRISGANRYDTAVAISQYGFPIDGTADTVFVATGLNFPDALAAGAAAAFLNGPVLLVPGTAPDLLQLVADEITRLDPSTIVVVGGTNALSTGIFDDLDALLGGDTVTRISGADRYATAVAISNYTFTSAARVYIATGLNFPDALAGAAAAGSWVSPILLVPGTSLPASVATEIEDLGVTTAIILGGTAVVTETVENDLINLIGP